MKLSPASKGFIIAVIVFVAAFGIYFFYLAKDNYYVVDNPSNKTFYYKINNGNEGIISSGQTVNVDLKKGSNKIQVFDINKKLLFDSAFTVNKIRGLINIAGEDYYINRQFYGYNLNKDSLLLALPKTKIDGKDYFGGPRRFNKIYTDEFYYNVDEDYDKVIKNIQKIESRTKIFRKQDYLNYYKEYYKF